MKLMISIISLLIAMNVVALPKSMHEKVMVLPQTDGWVDVPLTDKNPFDPLCKYRVVAEYDAPGGVRYMNVAYFQWFSTSDDILYATFTGGAPAVTQHIFSNDKTQVVSGEETKPQSVLQLQKRCQIFHKGQVGLFHFSPCLPGWKPVSELPAPSGFTYCERL